MQNSLLIGGRWTPPTSAHSVTLRSPHDLAPIGEIPVVTPEDVDRAVDAARRAFDAGSWARTDPQERADVVERLVDAYAPRASELAALVTAEMGMPITESRWRQADAVTRARHFVQIARDEFDWETVESMPDGHRTIVRREPMGVVAAIVPWNGPQLIAIAKVIPALLAGCSVILKPALETALDAAVLAEVLAESDLPEGVVSVLPADGPASEHLVAHPGVDKISFTGSTRTGRRIAEVAASRFARTHLELGGKSAEILLPDADLEGFADRLRRRSFANTGQVCTSHTRILATADRYDAIVDAVADVAGSLVIGDPADPATEIGPLASERQFAAVTAHLEAGVAEGARVVVGGPGRPDVPGTEKGWYVRPTVFADASNDMHIAQEEIFGPVLTIVPVADEAEAVRVANDSEYGLCGGVWTGDPEHGLAVGRAIRTGRFLVNGASTVLNAPFGGFKASGIGREYGAFGMAEYTEYKTMAV